MRLGVLPRIGAPAAVAGSGAAVDHRGLGRRAPEHLVDNLSRRLGHRRVFLTAPSAVQAASTRTGVPGHIPFLAPVVPFVPGPSRCRLAAPVRAGAAATT